jgi:hypothetical protein
MNPRIEVWVNGSGDIAFRLPKEREATSDSRVVFIRSLPRSTEASLLNGLFDCIFVCVERAHPRAAIREASFENPSVCSDQLVLQYWMVSTSTDMAFDAIPSESMGRF